MDIVTTCGRNVMRADARDSVYAYVSPQGTSARALIVLLFGGGSMRTIVTAVCLWLVLSGTGAGQQFVSTGAPHDLPYAIVDDGMGFTYRLDRTTGRVWRLETTRSVTRWIPLPAVEDAAAGDGLINYQLYVSREYRWALLMNVRSGATWRLHWPGSGVASWIPVEAAR